MNNNLYDVVVIGGGIVGSATALQILKKKNVKLLLIETEKDFALHQTGNNSGVIHSGLYYKPDSLKAKNCALGRELMYNFCAENNISHERCGKLVVATDECEIPKLDELERRGQLNGLKNILRLNKDELKNYEPHINGIEGLFVHETGIVNYKLVTDAMIKLIQSLGGEIKLETKFLSCKKHNGRLIIRTTDNDFETKFLINCAGLYSDRVAKNCGVEPSVKIIPFRGEYYTIKSEKNFLVKNLIYPVPDPRFPFLGVHFTRMIEGGIEAGPNAVLAFKREGYSFFNFSLKDFSETIFYPGFWKMAGKYWKMGSEEMKHSLSKKLFTRSLQKLIPEIHEDDLQVGGAGVRAQAVEKNGNLIDDFVFVEAENMIHTLNAPSPAATASLSIGLTIAGRFFSRRV